MTVQIEIKSRKGTFITLDDEDAEKIGKWGWQLRKDGRVQAYLPGSKSKKMVYLHQAVIWARTGEWPKEGTEIEYINGDKLDGRMENISVYAPNVIKIEGTSSVKIEIRKHKGSFITVDEAAADEVSDYGWWLRYDGYVQAYMKGSGTGKRRNVQLSHVVIHAMTGKWPEKGMEVDHLNHDPLDNRMENLRVVTKSGNQRNKNKLEGASSEFHGVYWNSLRQKWLGQVGMRIDGKIRLVRSSLTPDIEIAKLCADCIRDLVGGWVPRNYPERIFLDKWKAIGEKQRRKIFKDMVRHNIPIHDNTIFIAQKAA
jgi:hypothetical protein